MSLRTLLASLFFCCAPFSCQAAVMINEVAWMGGTDSANDEWIELYNDSTSAISVDGWTISDGQALLVPLTGTVSGSSYAVLERTDDNSAPGTALLVYTGALPNTGATLTLHDEHGNIIDQVAGGKDWGSIGGDNTTKETAQYTAAGWVTAVATPGAKNHTVSTQTDTSAEGAIKTNTQNYTLAIPKKRAKQFVKSTAELELHILRPEVVYVNQEISFEAVPSGIGDTIMDSLQYQWNFGDLATSSGKEAAHTFAYPGEYIVSLRATYARHDTLAHTRVTVLPVTLTLSISKTGDIIIHNKSPYEVDVSGYTLMTTEPMTFPELSFLARGSSLTIPRAHYGSTKDGHIALYDNENKLVTAFSPFADAEVEPVAAAVLSAPQVVQVPKSESDTFTFSEPTYVPAEAAEDIVKTEAAIESTVQKQTKPDIPPFWPIAGLFGLLSLGFLSVYASTQQSKNAE